MSKNSLRGESSNPQIGFKHVFTLEHVVAGLEHMKGEILTVIDSVIPQGPQNKCTKDIIKKIVRDQVFDEIELAKVEDPEGYGRMDDVRYYIEGEINHNL